MANQFALMLEALTELAPEIQAAQADPQPALPQLSEVLAEFSALPREALFLGLACSRVLSKPVGRGRQKILL